MCTGQGIGPIYTGKRTCGCRELVRSLRGPRSVFVFRVDRGVAASKRTGSEMRLAVVGVGQAAVRYSLMSPWQVGCRRIG
jgi:hypothetical protein